MSTLSLVYAVFPDEAGAKETATIIVNERLAACANVLAPCTSIYEWEGQMVETGEVPVLFKTMTDKVEALMARLVELVKYDVPAVVSWTADVVQPPFGEWVHEQTRK